MLTDVQKSAAPTDGLSFMFQFFLRQTHPLGPKRPELVLETENVVKAREAGSDCTRGVVITPKLRAHGNLC